MQSVRADTQFIGQLDQASAFYRGLIGADRQTEIGYVLDLLIENHPGNAFILLEDLPGHAFVPGIDRSRRFISEAAPLFVDQHAVGKDENRWLGNARARVHRFGVITAVFTAGRGPHVQRHLDAFAAVVIGAFAYRAQIYRSWSEVAAKHFGVAFKTTTGQYHRTVKNQIAVLA
ncbi:hypothetical protein D3C78_853610 [compost metagenome]